MQTKKALFYFFLFSSSLLFCQKNDTISQKKNIFKDGMSVKDKGNLFLKKTNKYRKSGDNDLFLKNLDSVFKYAKKDNNLILEAKAWMQEHSFYASRKGKSLAALSNYISIAQKTKDNQLLFNSYLKLSGIALKAKDVGTAKKYYKKATLHYKKWKNSKTASFNLHFLLARIYNTEEKFDSAYVYIEKLIEFKKTKESKTSLAQLYYLKGELEDKRKNTFEAFNWISKAHKLSIGDKLNQFEEISYAYIYKLLVRIDSKKDTDLFNKILSFYNVKSKKLASEIVSEKLKTLKRMSPKLMTLNTLSTFHESEGDYKKAIFYKNIWSNLNVKRAKEEQLSISKFMDLEIAISNLSTKNENLIIENKLNFTHKIILILSLVTLLILGLFIWSQQQLKIKDEKLSKLTAEKNFLKVNKERINLEKNLVEREIELNGFIRDMIEKNSQIEILTQKLKSSSSINSEQLIEELNTQKSSASKNWSEFVFKFKQLHPTFLEKLKSVDSSISPTETKLSILVFLNLTSKEIADLLNISPSSVNQGKYRLKKKLNIVKEKNITQFFQDL